jgi:cytochrome c-type biogenesis protein
MRSGSSGGTVPAGSIVTSGPLLLAIPVAAAAGALTFMSPCCLPLVPGYLSYVTSMAVSDVQGPATSNDVQPSSRKRSIAGAMLFVLGFSMLFATYGVAFGGLGLVLIRYQGILTRVMGVITIILGMMLTGAFERIAITGHIVKPSFRPRAGLAGAPLLGVMFGLGWTPCIGPTLQAVLNLAYTSGTAGRGAFLAFVYSLGLGVPFLLVAIFARRGLEIFSFARRHARLITWISGGMLVVLGLLEVSGTWFTVVAWLRVHWFSGYNSPI